MTSKPIPSSTPLSHTFASMLLDKGILSFDQLEIAKKEQQLKRISLEEALINLGFLSEGALAAALALSTGFERINLKLALLDPALKTLIPREFAEQYGLLPLALDMGVLKVALADVYNLSAVDALHLKIPDIKKIVPLIAEESQIREVIDHYYGYDLSIRGLLKEIEESSLKDLGLQNDANPTLRLVNSILIDGIKLKASDIHFEPEGSFMRLRYRIDGLLSQVCTLHITFWPAMCVCLKVMAEMNIAESRRPQNGRMTFYIGSREIDLRLASHPTIYGENIVVRILDKTRSLLSMDELGYSENVIHQLKKVLTKSDGIFIITGPTGCGKTTSLYSMLKHISRPELNIMTLEEPVEYQLPLIRQSNIKENGAMDFAEGVRSILRQDPDIILIGEIRDQDTAHMALRAAMTGHHVYSTVHTNDALGAVDRLLDLGLTRPLLAGHMRSIIAQRLIRRLCDHCKVECLMDEGEARLLGREKPEIFMKPKGCNSCRQTGYQGRLALAEILVFDEELEEVLLTTQSKLTLKTFALKKGYVPMTIDARDKVLRGETSLREVLPYIEEGDSR